MKKKVLAALAVSLLMSSAGLMLSSCSTVEPLASNAQNVVVSNGKNLAQCKKVGHVAAVDINGVSVAYTSHADLQKSQMNILKNKTAQLGGNVLVITEHDTTYVNADQNAPVDVHAMEGDAYSCLSKPLEHSVTPNQASDLTVEESKA